MARKADHLRVATAADAEKSSPKSLLEAVKGGDYREILVAQRLEIAKSIPDTSGPAKAALHRQLSLIAKDLQAMDASDQDGHDHGTPEDEAFDATAI